MSEPTPLPVRVDPHRVVRWVIGVWLSLELLLVALDATVNYLRWSSISKFRQMANIAREDGIATWFSSSQTLLVGLALFLVAWRVSRDENGKWRARGWALVGLFFTYLAFDDGAKVHERVASAVSRMAKGPDSIFNAFPSYAWQIVFGPVFVGMALFMVFFFWKEVRATLFRLLIAAGLGCYALAVGLDFIEGLYDDYERVADLFGWSVRFTAHYGRVLEEFLEMFGTTCFLAGFLGHFAWVCGPLDVRFGRREEAGGGDPGGPPPG